MYEPRGSFNDSRYEFEQKLNMLAEKIINKRISFAQHTRKTMNGLTEVRKLPNGRIDLNTVDESVRSTANMIGHFDLNPKGFNNEE
ncbi:AVAST type 1 anti-phage system protein Avs1c [Ancylomarina longa]|uniref:Uncharacterized protein n=1 Tax=Ancylomarina longa TaxID=2487017 RepID=A0A434AEP1_9BACT|nr:AVAST type 1 anti-phage system protein Avs1c [Ancylomarina longa]RUT72860.1 hypothetical protein DLK05_16305 [Ancylomarina longa]